MANYREQFSGEMGRKQVAKIQMSPLKQSVERRAPSVSSISKRGMTSGYCRVKASTGSIRPASTHGY